MLEIRGLCAGYGRSEVLREVSLEVPKGGLISLLGPNGAGKTTLMRSVSGLTRITKGEILFEGRSISQRSPAAIVAEGIIHVPQGRMLFPDLTVEENLQLGAYLVEARRSYRRNVERVEKLFPLLRERRHHPAGVLSGGEQQMLAIGRALMAGPRLLLLDEPSLGLAPRIVTQIFDVLAQINRDGVTILLAEQNAMVALRRTQFAYVLESGALAHAGPTAQLAESQEIQRSYLGVA